MSRSPARRRLGGLQPSILVLAIAAAVGCSGDGCSCLAPIPGGFPPAERTPNAAQIRISSTGIAAITADPAALVEALTGGPLSFDAPVSCSGTPTTCCPGGNPVSPCGPIEIDLGLRPGDQPRLVVTPVQGASRVDVTLRARVRTAMDVPISAFGANCGLRIDTQPGPNPDIRVDLRITLPQDPTTGTTRVSVDDVTLSQLTSDDVTLVGGFGCALLDLGLSFFIGFLESTFEDAIRDAVTDQVCKACPGGDVATCGPFATACTDEVCMIGDRCLQELGVSGRMAGAALLGGFSPGTTGAIDLYEVAGGYATTNSGGIALGVLGGMLPAGAPRDRCGPPATPPPPATIPASAHFQGNTRPDTGAPFDVAIGVHQHQLDRFAYSGYDGGFLCITVTTAQVALLTSDTIGLFIPSLANLLSGSAPMAIGLRPQQPPTIALGRNTFVEADDGTRSLDEPLLDIRFEQLELDIFVAIEHQHVRLFTLIADVRLPLGLEVGEDGSLTPVLGDLREAFTNLSVDNAGPLLETPEELAEVFPMLLNLALPQLAGAFGAIDVPSVGGLSIQITDITSVDDNAFLAIFGALAPASSPRRVDTDARVVAVHVPHTADFVDATRWRTAAPPSIELALGGSEPDLEWSVRVDGGLWSPWSRAARRTLAPATFWLQGKHRVEVRARRAGEPDSVDPTPVVIEHLIDTVAPEVAVDAVPGGARVTARDNVTPHPAMRWRVGGGAWIDAVAPATLPLWGRDGAGLEVEVIDEAGNVTATRGVLVAAAGAAEAPAGDVAARPASAPFHGQADEGGCGCAAGDREAPLGTLLVVVALALAASRRARRAARRARAAARAALVVAIAALPACDCGGARPCGDVDCLPGSLEPGPLGRFNGIATDGTRTVVSTYDQRYGDLVLVDVVSATERVYTAVDGVPDETPVHDPSTYRGGVAGDGPNVGLWTAVALHDGLARVAYQDRDERALRFALERPGGWTSHAVDAVAGELVGVHTSLALADGRPAIAYLALGVDDGAGGKQTELRLARAQVIEPTAPSAWQITRIAAAPTTCAGLCGSGRSCVAAPDTGAEVCVQATGDCATSCSSRQVCYQGECRDKIERVVEDLPHGTGLFATVLALPDGRLAIVHYDRVRTALLAHVEVGPGSGTFTEVVLDGGAAGADRGMWASAVADGAGTIHVAYQDALGDQVMYTTLGAAPGEPEVVDDGTRDGDRPHPVGAGAAIFVANGQPGIVYQDALDADLVVALRTGTGAWTRSTLAGTGLIDGFHVVATPDGRHVAWDSRDKHRVPAVGLEIRAR